MQHDATCTKGYQRYPNVSFWSRLCVSRVSLHVLRPFQVHFEHFVRLCPIEIWLFFLRHLRQPSDSSADPGRWIHGRRQWEWLYKLCSHIGFFRCLSCHSSLSCCHFPLLGALARRIQDQSSAYICLKPDKCGSKLHAERFKSVSVAIPFGTWNQTLSVHVGLALGHRTHGYRSGSRSTSSLLKVALRTNNAARRGAVKSTWQCSARDTQHGTFENMKVNATSCDVIPPASSRSSQSSPFRVDEALPGQFLCRTTWASNEEQSEHNVNTVPIETQQEMHSVHVAFQGYT